MSAATPSDPYRPTDPYEPHEPDASLPELVSRLTNQTSTLFRKELDLAKTELRQEIRKAGRAGGMFGGAAVAGFIAALLLSFAAAWGLGEVMPPAVGFLVVGVIWAIAAAILGMQGKNAADELDTSLPETTESIKEDVQWAKNQPR